ncbi:MAG: hypothetical protein WC343_12775 [Bacilli bacterium]|jgi:hypothetical protein
MSRRSELERLHNEIGLEKVRKIGNLNKILKNLSKEEVERVIEDQLSKENYENVALIKMLLKE